MPIETVETVERPEPGELAGAEATPEGAASEGATPPDDDADRTALLDRLQRLERSNAELNDSLYRMGQHREGPAAAPPEDRPPVEKVETWEDMQKYLDWRDTRLANSLRGAVSGDAMAVASEQRARGLFNREQMGNGRDYDALVARHIEPIERADPNFRRLLGTQRDPATARYVLATVLELIDRNGGDSVKGIGALWAAVDGKRSTTASVVKKIKDAADRAIGKTALKGSATGTTGKPTTADDLRKMSTYEFQKRFPNAVG
jgi:hypothetical protein